jgi:hypothetical protein
MECELGALWINIKGNEFKNKFKDFFKKQMGVGKPRGARAGRKLRDHRRD